MRPGAGKVALACSFRTLPIFAIKLQHDKTVGVPLKWCIDTLSSRSYEGRSNNTGFL
ncbi:hypothetical protein CY34DRAFT_801101 [Suillus luteus UH-Slu-Lm8-n1]|uniref:Uncharacterized protein n=1 Tax=Suillus luteus UH-Slu-Lm8-n1 TaxID=930992 RepID=A0A0D0B7H8_9AGAM|nr:hypothetical protein CY34DRAFT_801101 [Suillus luteus UH-Slu-Lm8-n1]